MKVRLTVVMEYELNPGCYPENATPQEMIDIDCDGFNEDPMNFMGSVGSWTVYGEVVE